VNPRNWSTSDMARKTFLTCPQFGFPPLNGDTATLAEFSTLMLRSAALCKGLLELTDELDRQ
jgi:hypothetical protein